MWLRGLLINGRKTTAVNVAMVINMVVTVVVLALGLAAQLARLAHRRGRPQPGPPGRNPLSGLAHPAVYTHLHHQNGYAKLVDPTD
jgi:hypothetical protein